MGIRLRKISNKLESGMIREEVVLMMMENSVHAIDELKATCSKGALITDRGVWRLQIPAGDSKKYRLAQLDDYRDLPREKFRWQPGCTFRLKARASHPNIPGTWGFGFWNDPFSMGILGGTGRARWPALPETAWFFFASAPGYISIRDDVPGRGLLAMTYAASGFWSKAAYLGLPGLPLLVFRPVARWARRMLARMIKQDAFGPDLDPTLWQSYHMRWEKGKVIFGVDDQDVFETPISPGAPLGFVLWIDNQYAAFTPDGRLGYGFLSNSQPAWIEVSDLAIETR
jgi:hypothetical protein